MKEEKFSLKKRLLSFTYAWNGLKILIQEEHNARIHLMVSIINIALGFVLNFSTLEWICIIFCITLVFALELINSALENLCDLISLEKNDTIKKIKDLAAAAVLVVATASFIIGLIIILPKLLELD